MLNSLSPAALDDHADPSELWPGEGLSWVTEARKDAPGLDSLLIWAFERHASRVAFQTSHPVWVRVHGRNQRATLSTLDEAQIAQIANHLYGADGTARLQGGSDFDVSYAIPITPVRAATLPAERDPDPHQPTRWRQHRAPADR